MSERWKTPPELQDQLDKANRDSRELEESMEIVVPYMQDHPERTVQEALDIMKREGRHDEVAHLLEFAARHPVILRVTCPMASKRNRTQAPR